MVRKRATPTAEAKAKRQQKTAKATLRNRYLSIKSGDYLDAHDFGEVMDEVLNLIDPQVLSILAAYIKGRDAHPSQYHYSVYRGFTEEQMRGLNEAQRTQLKNLTELADLSDGVASLNETIANIDMSVGILLKTLRGGQ
jgi:hypothetical protein